MWLSQCLYTRRSQKRAGYMQLQGICNNFLTAAYDRCHKKAVTLQQN